MRNLTTRIVIACLTLLVGVALSQALNWLLHRPRAVQQTPPCETSTPTPEQTAPVTEEEVEYPETSDLTPWAITEFIENNQRSNLKRLWERLKVKPKEDFVADFSSCRYCRAQITYYYLDNEPGDEALVKISNGFGEAFRYLVFKRTNKPDDWKLVGHVDAWGKYRDSQALVLASGGYNWLVIQGQSASGSGVAYYNTRVFEVTPKRLNEVAFYESEGYQSGYDGSPTKEFTSRIISAEKERGRKTVTVEYNIGYSIGLPDDKENTLFSKRQTAVFVGTANGACVLDTKRSTVTNPELDTIYHIHSMTDADFLQYNDAELVAMATHGNQVQQTWLRFYLNEYAVHSKQQRKLAALVK